MTQKDFRQFSPATERNREPIWQVLSPQLPQQGIVLELASGTGEHSIYFAPKVPHLTWLTSDINPTAIASIQAWHDHGPAKNLRPPLNIDVMADGWWEGVWDYLKRNGLEPCIATLVNINMIHISPWEATLGLMAGAKRLLEPQGVLFLYGPYKRLGEHTAPSNEQFDQSLRSRDGRWGVRDLEAVIEAAQAEEMRFLEAIAMPANNFSVLFQRDIDCGKGS